MSIWCFGKPCRGYHRDMLRQLIKPGAAAKILGIGMDTLRRWAATDKIDHYYRPNCTTSYYRYDEVKALARAPVHATPCPHITLLSVAQVAEQCGVSKRAVQCWAEDGTIASYTTPWSSRLLFHPDDVTRLQAQRLLRTAAHK